MNLPALLLFDNRIKYYFSNYRYVNIGILTFILIFDKVNKRGGNMVGYILVSAFIVLAVWGFISEHINHEHIPKKTRLRMDSKIIDFSQKGNSRKIGTNIETVVTFDDGYVYITHESTPSLFGVYTNETINKKIISDAMAAHFNAIEKQNIKQI